MFDVYHFFTADVGNFFEFFNTHTHIYINIVVAEYCTMYIVISPLYIYVYAWLKKCCAGCSCYSWLFAVSNPFLQVISRIAKGDWLVSFCLALFVLPL